LAVAEPSLIVPEYAISVLIALLVGALFPVMQDIRAPRERKQYILLQVATLIGAAIGCKLAVLFGETGWPFASAPDWRAVLLSGRSILGALIFGLLAAELIKPMIGYTRPPNDRFAAVLPFTFAIGRIGCLLHGCCRGVEYHGRCAIAYTDGIPRHPVPAYEIIFDVLVGAAFILIVKHNAGRGRLFSIYLILYGTFRFLTEFLRETPKLYAGWLSGYQVLSLIAIALGAVFLIARAPRRNDQPAPDSAALARA
jgi:phosphatidylglycerol:prolipoprotein diacylglycerol transferase